MSTQSFHSLVAILDTEYIFQLNADIWLTIPEVGPLLQRMKFIWQSESMLGMTKWVEAHCQLRQLLIGIGHSY